MMPYFSSLRDWNCNTIKQCTATEGKQTRKIRRKKMLSVIVVKSGLSTKFVVENSRDVPSESEVSAYFLSCIDN